MGTAMFVETLGNIRQLTQELRTELQPWIYGQGLLQNITQDLGLHYFGTTVETQKRIWKYKLYKQKLNHNLALILIT
jgi:hypothetical protein